MTLNECDASLAAIRQRQGTRFPALRVQFAGALYVGRLIRSDSDPERRLRHRSPFGVLVLEGPGLVRAPETILQIADIPAGGIAGADARPQASGSIGRMATVAACSAPSTATVTAVPGVA